MKRLAIAVFALLITNYQFPITAAFAAAPADLKQAIGQKAQELNTLHQQIQQTQKKIEENQGQQRTLKKDLQRLDYHISQLNLNIKSSEIKIQKTRLEIESLEYDLNDLRAGIAHRRQAMGQLLRRAQEKDSENLLLALLKNRTLAESLAELQNINDLNRSLRLEARRLGNQQEKVETVLGEKNKKREILALENQNLKNRQTIAAEQKNERQRILAQSKNEETVYQKQLSELEKKQAAISDAIEAIEDELRRSFDPTLLPLKRHGLLAMPIENPILTQRYGEVSWLYRGRPHNGADFGAPIGTPIFAADDGTVMAVGDNSRYQYGKYILIKHNNNLVSLYAHLSNNQVVSEGVAVKKGMLIGYSGNTGYTIGRGHLHFGLYWEPSLRLQTFSNCNCGLVPVGITINPLDYL